MRILLQVTENYAVNWEDVVAIVCLVLAVVLCLLDFFKFRSNLKIALILIAITLALWNSCLRWLEAFGTLLLLFWL
ncbi:unnamed protein product [Trichobilharzia szidati]|nr:unnamed protein product [Trichobilharzia szidati]